MKVKIPGKNSANRLRLQSAQSNQKPEVGTSEGWQGLQISNLRLSDSGLTATRRSSSLRPGETRHFVRVVGQVLRSTDMTKQSAYPLLYGCILRLRAIRKQDSSEQPARTLPAEIQPQR